MSLDCTNKDDKGVITDISGDPVEPERAVIFLREGVPVYECMNRDTFFDMLKAGVVNGNYISNNFHPQWNELLITNPTHVL